jgi:hypothetical protein
MNPLPGGSWYTSARKAQDYITRGRAVMEDGMLRFLSPIVHYIPSRDVTFWNGQPKRKMLRKVSIRRTYDPDCGPVVPMHRPGELRS